MRLFMHVIRKIYEKLPASIPTPEEFRHQKVEVIILTLEDLADEKVKRHSSLIELAGGLEKSKLALRDPLEIQKELRNEWT